MNKKFFVNRIYELCKIQNISIEDLIKKADIVPKTFYLWEQNKAVPSLKSLEILCDVFGISLPFFLQGYDENNLHIKQRNFIDNWRELSELEKLAIKKVISSFKKANT